MNHWPFIIGAYAVTILGTGIVTLWSWAAMRRAEAEAAALISSPGFPGEVAAKRTEGAPPPHFVRSPSPANAGEDMLGRDREA
jgi:heme export protein D (CcmD)